MMYYYEFESALSRIRRLAERKNFKLFHLIADLTYMYKKIPYKRLAELVHSVANDLLLFRNAYNNDDEMFEHIDRYITVVLTIMDFASNNESIQKSMTFSSIVGLRDLMKEYYQEVKHLRDANYNSKLILTYITTDDDIIYFLSSAFC